MTTRKQSAAAKAKKEDQVKAEASEAKAEPVPETPADAVVQDVEQEAQANAEAATTEEVAEAKADPSPETPTTVNAVSPDAEPVAAPQPTEIQGDTVTGDGTGNSLPPMEEMPGVFVRTKRRIKSRRRAGHRFNREGTGIALELLSDEQLEQLRNDPALEVEFCTFPINQVIEQES